MLGEGVGFFYIKAQSIKPMTEQKRKSDNTEPLSPSRFLNAEKIDRTGVRTHAGCVYTVGEKVSSKLNMQWGDGWKPDGWRTFRVACGVQKDRRNPTKLKCVDLSPPHDLTIQEMFHDISLNEGKRYYLVISRLDVNNRYDEMYKDDVVRAVCWLQDLYIHQSVPREARKSGSPAALKSTYLTSRNPNRSVGGDVFVFGNNVTP